MIARIGHLLATGVRPEEIMVLMFNRSARDSFEASMDKRLGPDFGRALPEVRTFHSLGHRLTQSFARKGALPDYSLVTEDFIIERLARQAAAEIFRRERDSGWPSSEEVEEFLNFIDIVKASIDDVDKAFARQGLDTKYSYFVDAYKLFEETRCARRMRFYSDLIREPVVAMGSDRELAGWVGNRVEHVIVDEYQDINEVQQRLLCFVAGSRARVMVVGDVDQCIYEWRGAQPDFITSRFAQDFLNPAEYLLSRTFRFGHSLSIAADYLISCNYKRDEKLCLSHETTQPTILTRVEEKGSHPIVADLKAWREKGRQLSEAVVLVRLFAQSIPVELALLEADIPYRLEGGLQVFACSEVMALIGYLRFADGQLEKETVSGRKQYFLAMLSQPHPGMQREELEVLAEELAHRVGEEEDALRSRVNSDVPQFIRNRLEEMIENWRWLRDCRTTLSASSLMEQVVSKLKLYDFYYSLAARASGAENRVKTCRAFIEFAGSRKESVPDFLTRVSLLQKENRADGRDSILITSVHRAKGLEWPKVYLPGLVDGVFPFTRECGDAGTDLEDERRLFYVAMTRAIEEVVFFHPVDPRLESNLRNGCTHLPQGKLQASRFLFEANIELASGLGRVLTDGNAEGILTAAANVGIGNRYLMALGHNVRLQSKQMEPEPVAKVLAIDELREGMSVYHPTFGAGTVTKIDDRRQGRLRVDFPSQGETVLLAAYARLQAMVA